MSPNAVQTDSPTPSSSMDEIFRDESGAPVKFFLPRGIPDDLRTSLTETICALGGRVDQKIPFQGYVLLQPNIEEEERLRSCWQTIDRPQRHFVPYSFVEACKMAGTCLKQIFVQNGEPLRLHIHSTIANVNARSALSQRIRHAGGDIAPNIEDADVILSDPATETFDTLVKLYQGQSDKHIESHLWVKKCIEKGCLRFTPVVYKNPGGRKAGIDRTNFTEEDDQHLSSWIATKIPDKNVGGRTGNKLYQELAELGTSNSKYSWVSRHPWQSWRERYKKNASRLNNIIDEIVQDRKIVPGEKGQYAYVRKAPEDEEPYFNKRRRLNECSNHEDPSFRPSQKDMMQVLNLTKTKNPKSLSSRHDDPGKKISSNVDTSISSKTLSCSQDPIQPNADDDESGWRVRVGNDAPPAWAAHPTPKSLPEKKQPSMVSKAPPMGKLDNEDVITTIAQKFRFTIEEVQEYYLRCRDLNRTSRRFQQMREMLEVKFRD